MNDLFQPTSGKVLRPHQANGIGMLRSSLGSGKKRPILQMPTGAGKTLTAAKIIEMALEKGNRVAFTVPAISLIDQTVEAFRAEGVHDIGVMQADHHLTDPSATVQVCSVQTLLNRDKPRVGLVIVDECHVQYQSIYDWMDERPELPFVGLSATPWASGLGLMWDDLLAPTTMRKLIDQGYLSDYRVFAPSHPDLTGVKVTAGDYNEDQLSQVMRDQKLVSDVVQNWLKHSDGDPTLVFAVDRAHARALQAAFAAQGIKMGYCDAYVSLPERKALFRQLARGEISGIVNIGTLTTGVDADIRCIVLARPTKSEMLFVQIIGRGLRTASGKSHCTVIDHTDTTLRLGMPCTIHRTKLSTGKRQKSEGKPEEGRPEPKPKECPKCTFVKPAGVHMCPMCGFEPVFRREVESADGDLQELKKSAPKFTREDKQRWWSELLAVAHGRGKSRGWCAHTYRAKFGVWPRGLDDVHAQPSAEVLGYIKHRAIKYAKEQEAKREETQA